MRIYVLRHGETDLNKKHVMQGWLDEPLNENGRALAARAGRALGGIRFDACYSSPLRRAAETAAIILRESGNTIPVTTDERLREICFGELDGTALPPETEARFFSDPRSLDPFPGGEHVEDVCRRPQAFRPELIRKDGVLLVHAHKESGSAPGRWPRCRGSDTAESARARRVRAPARTARRSSSKTTGSCR